MVLEKNKRLSAITCELINMIGFGTILKENGEISWVACLKQYFMRAPRTPVISINATHHHTDNDDHLLSSRLSNAHMWILFVHHQTGDDDDVLYCWICASFVKDSFALNLKLTQTFHSNILNLS